MERVRRGKSEVKNWSAIRFNFVLTFANDVHLKKKRKEKKRRERKEELNGTEDEHFCFSF